MYITDKPDWTDTNIFSMNRYFFKQDFHLHSNLLHINLKLQFEIRNQHDSNTSMFQTPLSINFKTDASDSALAGCGFPLLNKILLLTPGKRLKLGPFNEFLLAKPLKTRIYLLTFEPICVKLNSIKLINALHLISQEGGRNDKSRIN